jgi:hypothetical protein
MMVSMRSLAAIVVVEGSADVAMVNFADEAVAVAISAAAEMASSVVAAADAVPFAAMVSTEVAVVEGAVAHAVALGAEATLHVGLRHHKPQRRSIACDVVRSIGPYLTTWRYRMEAWRSCTGSAWRCFLMSMHRTLNEPAD